MKSTALFFLPCAAASVASSASSSVAVFSTHTSTLQHQSQPAGQRRAQSEIITNSQASDIVSSLSGTYTDGPTGGSVPTAVDVFTRPDYNLILSLPPSSDLLPLAPSDFHDAKIWDLEPSDLPVAIPAISSGLCAGSLSSSSFCPSGVSSQVVNASPSDASLYLTDLGVPSTFDAETGLLSVGGVALSSEEEKEVKELVGLISHLKSKKKNKSCDKPLPTNLYVASEASSPALSSALQALIADLLSVLKLRKCGSTITVLKGVAPAAAISRSLGSASTVQWKNHCADGKPCGNNSTSGYTDDYINNYSISLWVSVSFAVVVLTMMAATGGMTMNMDPILLANFKADLGDGKYD